MAIFVSMVGNADEVVPAGGLKVQPVDLAVLDPAGMPVGAAVVDTAGSNWILTVSTAVVDHVATEAVNGCPSLRWIKGSGGGGGGTGVDAGVTVTLGVDSQDWDFATALAGETDGDYRVSINIIADASGRTYTLMPNGANPTLSNGSYIYDNCAGPTMTANANQANSLVIGISNSGLACEVRLHIESKSGRIRVISGTFFTETSIVASSIVAWVQYVWKDTATVLTSLRLHGSTAGSIKATSTARIQKAGFLA